jgi:hypothetical protein
MKFTVRNHRGVDGQRREYVYYWCGGCGHAHSVPAARWNWNGDMNEPTLSPSVRHFTIHPETKTICHYHLIAGVIEYCGDCQHELRGQKIPLQDIPDDYGIPEDDSISGV